jgi:hypothetical protein
MEIRFAAQVIDQLDFALDHLLLEDPNYQRLSLMLIDNALELALHRHAQETLAESRWNRKISGSKQKLIEAAQGQRFGEKLKLAKHTKWIDERVGRSVETLHGFRNKLYHGGLAHERILHALALFYFQIVCDLMLSMPAHGYSWSSSHKITHRAIKYLGPTPMRDCMEAVPGAWRRLREVSDAMPWSFHDALKGELASRVAEVDENIEFIVKNAPDTPSRDEVVLQSQAWHVAFTDEGKNFAISNGLSQSNIFGVIDYIALKYPFGVKKDPIKRWESRVQVVSEEEDPHKCLEKFRQLFAEIQSVHVAVESSAIALSEEIDRKVDAARGA